VKLNLIIVLIISSFCSFSQEMLSFEEKPFPKFNLIDNNVLTFCTQQDQYKKLNKEEKEFYYWVNYSRNNPRKFFDSVILPIVQIYPQLKNEYLTSLKADLSNSSSLPLLSLNSTLTKMAKDHSEDITSHNVFASHNSTNGDGFPERFRKNGLRKCGGENISYGANNPVFLLTLLYIDVNIPSLGHRKALLNPNFVETGIGDSFYKDGSLFFVEDFACGQN
jgi:hypothetical protein